MENILNEPGNAAGKAPEGNKSPPRDSGVETHTLRARRFPSPSAYRQSSTTSSRRATTTQGPSMRDVDTLQDNWGVEVGSSSPSPTSAGDPFFSIIFPDNMGSRESDGAAEKSNTSFSMRQRDSFCRTQVCVEGYFQDEEDGFWALIPNDLPRSTILYVMTSSEGRDKLFKCLQYGLHLMICLLKRPMLFATDAQNLADYWATRFWRNINTIRHGRSLFKLGRWVLNVFFLEEVLGRLALKYGIVWSEVVHRIVSALFQFLHIPLSWRTPRHRRDVSNVYTESGTEASGAEKADMLLTDEVYSHVARAEFSMKPQSFSMTQAERNTAKPVLTETSTAAGASEATRVYMKEKFYDSISEMEARRVSQQQQLSRGGSTGPNDSQCMPPTGQSDSSTHDSLSTPPDVEGTLPASFVTRTRQDDEQSSKKPLTKLLRPLCATGAGDDVAKPRDTPNNGTGTQKASHVARSSTEEKTTVASHDFFASYPILPYEPRLGAALPLHHGNHHKSSVNNNNNINGNNTHNNSVPPCSGTKSPVCRAKLPPMLEDCDDDMGSSPGPKEVSDIDLNPASNGILESKEDTGQAIPAEMGKPEHWRKRLLQFSTSLMLLLGVRSIATIGRRTLRDILLLSSERFFNVSCVEKNRPVLQRRANWLWLAVAAIDLFLNTIRLMDRGWYKYATARHNALYHCQCKDDAETDLGRRYRYLVARRNADLYFPAVDFDFGAPLCSSPAYFEAAAPQHIAPACRACGCLFVEGPSGTADALAQHEAKEEGKTSHRQKESVRQVPMPSPNAPTPGERAEVAILRVPWLVNKLMTYVLLLQTHPNLTATILLQVRYMTEVYLAFMYCFGGYETGKSDAALGDMLHLPGAIAGMLEAVLGLHRVMQSAPK
ncbi:hypothetical protein TraAM80_05856 [Trypanosoma rangeli]|uniref:Uncharacterized protein n=1 Tax=Trypanosoma rangeli TaxID=5698 RepID=A0A3R7MCG1_TRYRA|nr:uncharacterized protein TraAM80_05856 [Trypanosoma rangeli]RNF03293.1 hypothetical protein TraAM80_05856 [Trypanosoma rangeli]|eukprot:RNF03293.1 hypothetical protein TraAM80_05856 [Trypanosoma rangeli]